ncbi:peptide/nickel transport system substrate-binding protein [Halobiforma haloterrestris]|uniref:Peptide/nickel transport system substrate-binding protein n=1 Tax=Natronobacterium haloterrestre TaxID=148448 RepID=A0A1I1KE05_NATHA|nr:ABC transporter substrate-binding protein [Halobiforma haloterrestris]SFC59036.1 peptide/nickel transport system substrate-binding protein [Halobiforma haloterrestris]
MKGANNIAIDRRTLLKLTGAAGTTTGLAALAGCMGEEGEDGEEGGDGNGFDPSEMTVTLSQFPDTIDPLDHITGDYFDVYDHIYEPLFDFEPGEGIFPRVAEDWEAQGDGTTEVYLRDDVVFHNGDDLTAEDVAWTIERTIDPEMGVPSPIGTFGLGSIEGAEAVDETTVAIEYGAAPGLAEFEFGNYARALNRQWAIDNHDAENDAISGSSPEDFNGTGPYEVVDFTSGEEIVLERFDDYWGDEPPFEQVTFNADSESSGRVASLEAGETDLTINILPEDVATVQEAPDIEVRRVTSFRNIFCPMKNTVEPFDSQEFRQAMNYAVDNTEIVETALSGFGEPRGQPVAPGINGFNDDIEPYEQDIGMAESLVEESGYGGAEIELVAPQGRYLNDADIAEMVADQIDQLENVSCEASIVDFGVVSDANQAGVDPDEFGDTWEIPFYMIGWGTITGDTDYGVQGFFTIPDNPNRTFDDEELSDAILESQQIEDPDERRQKLEEVNQLAHEKAPFVFLHTQESIYGIREEIQWEPREDETVYLWGMDA